MHDPWCAMNYLVFPLYPYGSGGGVSISLLCFVNIPFRDLWAQGSTRPNYSVCSSDGCWLVMGGTNLILPDELASSVCNIEQIFSWFPDALEAFMFWRFGLRKTMAPRDFIFPIIVTQTLKVSVDVVSISDWHGIAWHVGTGYGCPSRDCRWATFHILHQEDLMSSCGCHIWQRPEE